MLVKGWTGKIDAKEQTAGLTLNSAKLDQGGQRSARHDRPGRDLLEPGQHGERRLHRKATFSEPKYMNLNDHPHPYGIMIAGNDLGTDQQSYLYCAAYGNGTFIVRGFGPKPFQMGGRAPIANQP